MQIGSPLKLLVSPHPQDAAPLKLRVHGRTPRWDLRLTASPRCGPFEASLLIKMVLWVMGLTASPRCGPFEAGFRGRRTERRSRVSPHPQDAAPLKHQVSLGALQALVVVSPHPQDAAPLKHHLQIPIFSKPSLTASPRCGPFEALRLPMRCCNWMLVSPHPQDAAPLKRTSKGIMPRACVSPHPQDAAPLKLLVIQRTYFSVRSHRIPKMRPL